MTSTRAIKATRIIGGAINVVDGVQYVFVDFEQPKFGSAPLSIALPIDKVYPLAQIAMQVAPAEMRHGLLEQLVSLVDAEVPKPDGQTLLNAFEIGCWAVSRTAAGKFLLTFGLDAKPGSLTFQLDRRNARAFALDVVDALKPDQPSIIPKPHLRHPFLAVAEDIEWFRDEWVGCDRPPACGQLRRATGTLRQLLLHQAMQKAWRFVGFKSGPRIVGPNLEALMSLLEHEKHHTLVMTAGGFEIDRLAIAAISLRKVQNPSTGVGPDADEGFAIQVSQVSRSVIEGVVSPETELSAAVHHEWANIESYMAATGAVRLGQAVSRKSILEYFAYYSGGVHLDRVKNNPKIAEIYLLHEDLEGKADIFGLDGLHAELLAMGQAIGSSPDCLLLSKTIREAAERDQKPPKSVAFGIKAERPL